MYIQFRSQTKKIFHAFSTRTRMGFVLFLTLLSTWYVAQFVLAEKESNIYIFPTTVSSEGWENDVQALGQDLSPNAELTDFLKDNSAYIFFGPHASTSSTIAPDVVTPMVTPDVTPHLIPQETISPDASSLNPDVLETPAVVTSTNGTTVPAAETTSNVPVMPSLELPILPAVTIPTELSSSSPSSMVTVSPQLTFVETFEKRVEKLFAPHVALAQDAAIIPVITSSESIVQGGNVAASSSKTGDASSTVNVSALHIPIFSNSEMSPDTSVEGVGAIQANASSTAADTMPEVTPMSSDPYTVLSCVTEGIACHVMSFVGFGIGESLSTESLLSTTLELSVAGRGNFSGDVHDRLVVRAFHNGRWEYLGETEIKGEFSNAKRGGYLSYDLPSVAKWSDLADLKIVVEYVREGERVAGNDSRDSSVSVDGIWVNVKYSSGTLSSSFDPSELALTSSNVRSALFAKDAETRKTRRDTLTTSSGEVRTFTHADDHADAKILIKTDRDIYHAFGKATTYFNVTNTGTGAEVVRLQFHFPTPLSGGSAGRVTELARFAHNVPYKVGSLKYDAIGYFCASTWSVATSTDEVLGGGSFTCAETQEVESCDSLNEDKTNCIQNSARVGLSEDVEYRDGWTNVPVKEGSFRDDVGLFRKAIDFILSQLPGDAIPPSEDPVAFAGDSMLLEPGQTIYFRADAELPLNGKGDFYVEAAAESGEYGLVHASWDGSWNYRIPVDVANDAVSTDGSYAIPVSLDNLPESFWSHVGTSGSDLRFVDGDAVSELPYWLASWDYGTKKGLAWVRVPNVSTGTSTRIFLYYGDQNAESNSDSVAPFRTDNLTTRGIVFGKSQQDMMLHVIALAENVRVVAGVHDEVLLKKGESALFDAIAPGMEVRADGPVTLSVEAPGGNASVVPMGYAGSHFIAPGIGGERNISMSTTGENTTHVEMRDGEQVTSIDPVAGSIVGSPVTLSSSQRVDSDNDIALALSSDETSMPTPLYPSTDDSLYGFAVGSSYVGFGTNGGAMTVLCSSSGERQEVDGRREGAVVNLNRCNSGIPEVADAIRVQHIVTQISALTNDQQHLHGFLPRSEFASAYTLPEDASQILVLCAGESGAIPVGVFDPQRELLATSTCEGIGQRPGKVVFETPAGFALGSEIRSLATSSPTFMAAMIGGRIALSNTSRPLSILSGAPLSRSISPNHPELLLGEEEFVIPGEHRALDLDTEGKEKDHVDKLLSSKREFSVKELPGFQFHYTPQSNSLMQGVRDAFGIKPFTVNTISLRHVTLGVIPVDYDVSYGDNNDWSLTLKNTKDHLRPGKYTVHIEIEEGGTTYVDEYDFYWGVLAINENKSVYTPGEEVAISIGALSDNGNTLCDAKLKLWITPPSEMEEEVPVATSGKCDGNTVVDVPDYTAVFRIPNNTSATGTYAVKLVRFDEFDNIASQVTDTIEVRESVPFVIEREGPTRIYPVAHYPMKIRVTANQDFEGNIVEKLPGDFVVIDRGNANLEWGDADHTFMTATWVVNMKAGAVINLSYVFDAPDVSPYLFRLGPLSLTGSASFTELREWQIASDAVGNMLIFWDGTGADPAGWTCVSCTAVQPFYQRYPYGSSSYDTIGQGFATHTHSITSTLYSESDTAWGQVTAGAGVANYSHTHTLAVTVANASNTPATRTVRILRANSSGDQTLPTGAIVSFDIASSSLPSGWLRYSAQDGYFPMGENSVGSTSGKATTSHAITAVIGTQTGTDIRTLAGGTQNAIALNTHAHAFTATTTSVENGEPPYVTMMFAKLTGAATTTPNYAITMWDNTAPAGWTSLSNPGGPLDGKFLKAAATYGSTGGVSTHTHLNMDGMFSGVPSTTGTTRNNAAGASATNVHTHQIDIDNYSTVGNMPRYWSVIFAKKLTGVVFYEQNFYRVYANQNANTVTDPWPLGGIQVAENTPVDAATQPLIPTDVMRIRVSLNITNATATVASAQFKMQYVDSNDCVNALNWTDVGAIGSGAVWRGYHNSAMVNNVTLATSTLTTSHVAESYVEQNNSTGTPALIDIGLNGEWDWVIQDNSATSSTNYCFRMVKSDGTPLDTYTDYPQVLTNAAPDIGTAETPFDNEKVPSTLPDLYFHSVDAENDDLDYEVQVATNVSFVSPTVDKDSSINPELFDNVPNPTNKAPFNSGDKIHFVPGSALTNGSTYWWRIRAKDAAGSNSWGAWSVARSFTIDTTVITSTWFQTTRDQFLTDTLSGATTTGADDVQLITGSTTGSVYSSPISFSLATIGTAWGKIKWNSNQTNGNIRYQVEYLDSTTGLWNLIPDTDLAGNSTAFGGAVGSTSLLTVDASVYDTIRLRANLTNIGGTPMHLDWTLDWGYKVTTPNVTVPFDNAKVATRTPTFAFSASDPQNDKLVYQISWSTTTSFTASTTRSSDLNLGFVDVTTPTSTTPFNPGDVINYTVQAADILTNGTTYYYRIRARDPSGANDWSFWSDTRSLTVDTAVVLSTWYQTDNGQFLTDIFTSARTVSTGSTTVATSTDEAMVAYGEGTVQTPRYRFWDGTAWGTEKSALSIGATLRWAVLHASPLYGEYMLATMGSDRDVNLQVYNNGAWGNFYKITGTSPNISRRSFDVSYESISGRALVVACSGTADPTYAIWSGTSSSWVATGTVNLTSTTDCEWIKMASDPKTNEIALVARDTGLNYEAQIWNATTSSWGNSTGVFGSMTEVGHEGMAIEYEASGDQVVVAVSRANNAGFVWRAWRRSTATWTAAANQTMNDDYENGNLHRDPNSDNMVFCAVTNTPRVDVLRWTGAGFVAFVDLSTVGLTKNDKPVDCAFENTAGRSGYIQTVFGDTTGTRYREWTGAAWAAQVSMPSLATALSYTAQVERTSFSGTLLSMFFVPGGGTPGYYESHWATSSWSNAAALEISPSVTAAPYGQPFSIAPKNPATQGTIVSTPINFADGVAPAWNTVTWSSTTPTGSSFKVQVQYYSIASSSWGLIPDTDLPGNSAGATSMSINIKPLNTDTYSTIRLVGNFSCLLSACPVLNDWTVTWAQGLNISGTAKAHDLATNVTSGTVAVAVNGVLQVGKTGTIGGGVWTIPNVTIFPGNTVEVFTSGGATSTRAIGIAKYDGPGDFGGLALNERWVTIGSASGTAPTAITLTDLAKYDNSVSAKNDIFFDVDNATGNYNHCVVSAGCDDSSLYVLAGNTFQPATSSAKTISTFDFRLAGYLYLNANTLKVGASWRNLGGYTPGTGTLLFNATSTNRTIDSTGAATSTFGNVTFGEAATLATWSFSTPFVATGTVAMNFGSTSPGSQSMTLQGDLSIGASGTFLKGTATTTFAGVGTNTWTDSTASKQDLGNITVNGTTKTVTLGSSVKATHVNIVTGNTLNAGGVNTFTVLGFWDNAGTFTPQSSTVNFATSTAGMRINQGVSSFYNLTFNGVGGTWSWLNTNATTTNDLTITAGTVTLPGGTLSVGGSFTNTGGTFTHNSGVVKLYSTLTGKSVRANNSSFFDLVFDGAGGAWSFVDTNATTTNTVTILAGTPTLPSGVFEVGNNFINSGGSIVGNGGTLKMTSVLTARTITLGSSALSNLRIQNAGVFTITDSSASVTGDVTFNAGTTTLPAGTFSVGGSFTNTGVFIPGTGTVTFNTSSGVRTVNPGNTSFGIVSIAGTGGSLTFSGNATTTGNFTITSAASFSVAVGKTLAVGGIFTNLVGGGATTWTGSILALNSGTNYTVNTKAAGGDGYGTLRLGNNTMIRSWNSSSTAYIMGTNASLYSQNHGAVNGEVDIFGTYTQSSGTDYWDYATDFDGTSLGGSPRQANVRFDAGATASFGAGSTLEIVGTSTASTTIDRRSAGNFGITLTDATLNANYYQVRNMNAIGLNLAGATTITYLGNGDYSLDVIGGSSITVAATTIDANPGIQIFGVKFATSSGISSGYNVTEVGAPLSYWRFKDHYGNYAGENHDNDPEPPTGNPGYIRWDDSNFTITITGRIYADAGVTPLGAPTCDNVTNVVRVKVDGGGTYAGPCSSANGNYAVSGIAFSGDTSMTIYLDTNGGARAALVTRSAAADLSGMNLYRNRVIVRHEDVFPISIANMAYYSKTQDSDIPYTAATGSPSTLIVSPDTEFWVWTGMTFVPGGNVTTQSGGTGNSYDGTFHIDNSAVFTAQGTENHSVGGTFIADAGAIFTAASSTFNFTATTTGKSVTAVAPLTFWKMNWNGTGGNWSINQSLTVGSDFTVNAGTVSGANNVTVYGTTMTGSGAIAMTGGAFTLANGGTFGGNTNWSFSDLTFGNGTLATTTKTGSSTVTVSGILTDSPAHTLQAGTSTTWVLTGGGTPLVLSGAFTVQNATVRYAASGASANVTPATYAQLEFSATGAANPTYTMNTGTFAIGGPLFVGNSSSSIVVNANINDPVIVASGDVNIKNLATLVASDISAFTARRNWSNLGTTTASGGTMTFDATTTGFTIDPGKSPFANVIASSSVGGWTITQNATATGAFTISKANSFTLTSGKTLEVGGVFSNLVGGSATTWTGSTLYLNSGAVETINTKSIGADQYATLLVGANTQARMWNSVAATTTLNSTGSIYSMNHNAVSGSLYIYGAYTHASGNDYWDYATDFDGATGTARQVNVRIATSSTLSFTGGGLDVTGTPTASTTVDVQGTGAYALNVSGGTFGMSYYSIRNTDANGLNISGSPSVSDISDGDFQLAVTGGTMIKVAGGSIDANPLLTFQRNRFGTSTGVSSGYNVTATGASASAWRFNLAYGVRAGEAFDNDPGGDPGYLIWDDSAAQLVISGNVYSDEGKTPIGLPTCDGVTQNVRLKVQGGGSYASACNTVTGAYSISGVIFNPKDTLTAYLDTNGGAKAVNIAYDPATNINTMHLYQNRIIIRHEQGTPVGIASMARYDNRFDTDIPFTATTTGATSTSIFANTGLIVWNSKVFAPGGNVTINANASGNAWDGSVSLYSTSTWSGGSTESYTIGGQFFSAAAASVAPANSTFTFTATTTGKAILASSSLTFYNLAFNGVNGAWDLSGVGTTSNDFTITNGTTTLPSGTLVVGGSFANTGGTFIHNGGTIKFTSTAAGKTVRSNGSLWNELIFSGSGGGWTFTDTNATTSGSVTILAGTPILPTGILSIGNSFDNQGGAFTAGSGTVKLTSTSTNRTIRLSGSSLGNLLVSGTGTFLFLDQNATTTGDMTLSAGTTTFPFVSLGIGGSFTNSAVFTAGTSTVTFFASAAGKTITTGSSTFNNMIINGASGGFTIAQNATTTGTFSLLAANSFTLASGKTLEVKDVFMNLVGGAGTTWTGTLYLNSGTSYTANTKTLGLDTYNSILMGANTQVRMWGSSGTTVQTLAGSGLYSQNNGGVAGSLYIYGDYARTSGTDYWSYATDFDGTALGGSSRQANVRFATSATATFSNNTTLQMLGSATASTTVDRQSAGNYSLNLVDSTWNAKYYQFRNSGLTGVSLLGTTTITSMDNGDYSLDITGGTSLTIASTTIDQNASAQMFTIKFATSSGVTSGYNVTRTGTTTSAITFNGEYGNYAGETYDNDGPDGCGSIRWTDSTCLISDQRAFRFRNDDGGEGALASEWYNQSWGKRKRVHITNNTASLLTNIPVKMTVAYDSEMQTSFQDLRFTDSSGTTSIPYWIEASTASTQATVWVNVPSLPGSSYADVFMYFANATATYNGAGTTTFLAFDDFEDGFANYTGDTALFAQSSSMNKTNTYGLSASAGNVASKNTDGIRKSGVTVGRDTTWHFWQKIDMSTGGGDEPCFTFGVQSPVTAHQNYGVCLQPYGLDHVSIVKNAIFDGLPLAHGDGASQLATTTVTFTTGWYEVYVNWLSSGNQINVSVYDGSGSLFATTSASDSTFTSGSYGFTFWGQHGGWDDVWVAPYFGTAPSVTFGTKQADSGATWLAAENTYLPNYPQNQNVRARFSVRNSSLATLNENFLLQVAAKIGYANCESVPTGNYADATTAPTSPARMMSSTQFVNKASTTQLLSIPSGQTFTYGQMIEDPSNETDLIALPAAQYTEVEYNFQMTASAPLDRYCLRVVNGVVGPLNNYSRVAEIQVMHPPTISDLTFNGIPTNQIALTEGTTTNIIATATVTDLNGYTDLVAASSTYYRSSISGGNNCAADKNNCYQIATTSCGFSNCTGNTCLITCTTPMYYFADPTDIVSAFASDVWDAFMDVWDSSGAHNTSTANKELTTVLGLSAPSAINYGSIVVGQDSGSNNSTTTINNTGNSILNLNLSGDPLISGASSIPTTNEKYASSTFTYSGCAICNLLTNSTSTPDYFGLGVSKPTSTSAVFKNMFWGINIPIGTAASTHNGKAYFEAKL